jgi:uncharacterized membrane protein YhaH (DUF805 family)
MDLIHLLFGFQGRISRASIWFAVLIWAIFLLAVIVITGMMWSIDVVVYSASIAILLIMFSAVPVGIRRLHDRDKTGWWLLLFYGAPALSLLVSLVAGAPDEADNTPVVILVLEYLSFAVLLWALVELGFLRGTIGGNVYGPDPLAPKLAKH